ncbi:DUF4064 domain-containing protein [Staphylococcus caeli]|uniref:DUF4064 domain-containing protein n=1 Tax=Staphylococcus caeli TaxID=2201815 RepID=UPI003F570175
MMKRTIERVLTWIGIVLQLLGVVFIAIAMPLMGNSEIKDSFIQGMMEEESTFSYQDGTDMFNVLSGLMVVALIIGIILLIVAVIAAFLIGKKSKVAGILLIVVGVISLVGSWINAILWLVAGIMLLVRKPKAPIYGKEEEGNYNPYIKDGSQVNEHNNSFVLSEDQKKREQETIKDEYSTSQDKKQDLKDFDDLDERSKKVQEDPYKY